MVRIQVVMEGMRSPAGVVLAHMDPMGAVVLAGRVVEGATLFGRMGFAVRVGVLGVDLAVGDNQRLAGKTEGSRNLEGPKLVAD